MVQRGFEGVRHKAKAVEKIAFPRPVRADEKGQTRQINLTRSDALVVA
jgi:hypothetical protein